MNEEGKFEHQIGQRLETIEEVPEPALTIPNESIAIWQTLTEKVDFLPIYEEERPLLNRETIFQNELAKVETWHFEMVKLAHSKIIELVQIANRDDWRQFKNKDNTIGSVIEDDDGFRYIKGEGWI